MEAFIGRAKNPVKTGSSNIISAYDGGKDSNCGSTIGFITIITQEYARETQMWSKRQRSGNRV